MKKLLLTLLLSTGLYASQEDSELSHLDANSTYLRIKENLSQEIYSDDTKFSIPWHEDIKTDSTNSITEFFPTQRFTLDDDGLLQEILTTNNDDSLQTNQSLDPLLKDTDTTSIYKDYKYSIDCLEEQSIPNSNSFICSVNSRAPTTSTTNKIIYKCTEEGCDKSFTSNWYLTSHIKTHGMEKIYKCKAEGCDTSFSTFLNLKEHIKTHKVKKSYKCTAEGCNYSTAYNQTLIAHIEAHKKKNLLNVK